MCYTCVIVHYNSFKTKDISVFTFYYVLYGNFSAIYFLGLI